MIATFVSKETAFLFEAISNWHHVNEKHDEQTHRTCLKKSQTAVDYFIAV